MGLKVSAMPDEYVAEAVVAMLKEKVAGRRVLLARAAVARDVIPEQLRQMWSGYSRGRGVPDRHPRRFDRAGARIVWRREAAARRGDLYQLLDGKQFFCAARCGKDGAAARTARRLDRPGHDANLTPA